MIDRKRVEKRCSSDLWFSPQWHQTTRELVPAHRDTQLECCTTKHKSDIVSLNTVAKAALAGSGLSTHAKTFVYVLAFHMPIEV